MTAVALAEAGASVAEADAAALADALHRLSGELGNIDFLVNNAGVSWPVGPTADMDPEHFAQAVAINLVSAVRCIRHVLPGMLQAAWARIVNGTTAQRILPGRRARRST